MSHVVTKAAAPFRIPAGLTVHQVPAATDNLVWVIATDTGEAAVVDGPDAEATLAYCAAHGLRLTTILNTHTHGDHVGINRDLAKRGMLSKMRVVGSRRASADVPGITEQVDEGDEVKFGGATARVFLTEGHINGHISFVFDGAVFCGDTMFGAGCGYLFDGPPAKMHLSLERLAALPGDTRVCCAHEYTLDNLRFAWSLERDNALLDERIRHTRRIRAEGESSVPSTIETERATNPFLRHGSQELRRAVKAAMPDRALDSAEAIFAATRALKDRKDYKTITDAELPA